MLSTALEECPLPNGAPSPIRRSPYSDKQFAISRQQIAQRTTANSSRSGSFISTSTRAARARRDSRSVNPRNSGSVAGTSFHPLTLPHLRSDVHFLDFTTFQSFTVPFAEPTAQRPSSRTSAPTHSLSLLQLPSLSQPLFESKPMDKKLIIPPSFTHPNSPYVPFDSPVRRQFFRPLTPESYVSHFSGFSRSGAVAPEPWSHESYHEHAPIRKMSHNLRKIRRKMKENLSHVVRRITRSKPSLPEANWPNTSSDTSLPDSPTHHHPPVDDICLPSPRRMRSMSDASFMTTQTNSLAQWLDTRRQISKAVLEEGFTLEEYERVGSWINSDSGTGTFGCGISGCQFHPHFSPGVISSDNDDTTTCDESSVLDADFMEESDTSTSARSIAATGCCERT